MTHNTMPINIGDWVYSYSPGIWKVYRVLQGVQKLRSNLQEEKRVDRGRHIFSKRLVDEVWKPAFATETASADVVFPLSDQDRRCLEEFIVQNPQIMTKFEVYQPKEIDLVRNLPLNVPLFVGRENIERLTHDVFTDIGDRGLTNDEVLQRIAGSELFCYTPKTIRNATLQFISKGHEIRNDEYIFREVRVIMV